MFQNNYSGILISRTLSFLILPITQIESRFPLLSQTPSFHELSDIYKQLSSVPLEISENRNSAVFPE